MEPFTNANWIALLSAIISLIAFITSLLTGRKAKALDLKLKEIQLQKQNKEDIESKKADVEVDVIETRRGQNNKLRFYNKGKSVAHNINFEIPSDSDDDIQLLMSKDYLPYPKLQPQQSFDIVYLDYASVPHYTIVICWDDDFSKIVVRKWWFLTYQKVQFQLFQPLL